MTKTVDDIQDAKSEAQAHLVNRIKGSIEYKMDRTSNHLQELKARLNENYLHYFAECGLSIYKNEYQLKVLKRVRESLEDAGYEDATGVIEMWVKCYANELLKGALSRHSTCQITNITYVAELEAKQRMREYFIRLQDILSEI